MPTYFFEATEKNGAAATGAIDADNAEQAVDRLTFRGYGNVRLLNTGSTLRNDLAGKSDAEVQQHARHEIAFKKTKSRQTEVLLSVVHVARNWWIYLTVLGIFTVRDLLLERYRVALLGALLMLLPFVWLMWNRRHVDRYRALQVAMCYGEWDKSLALVRQLRERPGSNDQLRMDLDIREAQALLRKGELTLEEAMARLAVWRPKMASKPGAFEARVGGVYRAGNAFKQQIESFRISLQALPQEASRQVDLALAEARFGDIMEAKRLIETLNTAALVDIGFKFVDWINGLVALHEGRLPEAELLLRKASLAFEQMSRKTPTALSTWSLSAGALALTLAKQGRKAEARKELGRVWTLLRVSGDPSLMEDLRRELGPQVGR